MANLDGIYSYQQSVANDATYGQITFKDAATGKTPEQISNTDFFEYLLQDCKFYKNVFYDISDMRAEGWDYESPQGNHAPQGTLIRPFKWKSSNDNGINVSLTLTDQGISFISSDDHIVVGGGSVKDTAGNIRISSFDSFTAKDGIIKQAGYDSLLSYEVLCTLNMLSHFIDKNIFSGTQNVFIDNLSISCDCTDITVPPVNNTINLCVTGINRDGNRILGLSWKYPASWDDRVQWHMMLGREESGAFSDTSFTPPATSVPGTRYIETNVLQGVQTCVIMRAVIDGNEIFSNVVCIGSGQEGSVGYCE